MKKIFGYILLAAFFSSLSVLCPIDSYAKSKKQQKKVEQVQESKEEAPAAQESGKETTDKVISAEENTPYDYTPQTEEDSSYGWLIFKTIIVLGLLGGGFYLFFKFVSQKTGMPAAGRGAVHVLSITPVGQGKFVQIVEVGGKLLILGVTENNISLISEVRERDEIDRIKLQSSKATPLKELSFPEFVADQVGAVTDFVKKKITKKESAPTRRFREFDNIADEEKVDFMKEQKDRLKRMNRFDE